MHTQEEDEDDERAPVGHAATPLSVRDPSNEVPLAHSVILAMGYPWPIYYP